MPASGLNCLDAQNSMSNVRGCSFHFGMYTPYPLGVENTEKICVLERPSGHSGGGLDPPNACDTVDLRRGISPRGT